MVCGERRYGPADQRPLASSRRAGSVVGLWRVRVIQAVEPARTDQVKRSEEEEDVTADLRLSPLISLRIGDQSASDVSNSYVARFIDKTPE